MQEIYPSQKNISREEIVQTNKDESLRVYLEISVWTSLDFFSNYNSNVYFLIQTM